MKPIAPVIASTAKNAASDRKLQRAAYARATGAAATGYRNINRSWLFAAAPDLVVLTGFDALGAYVEVRLPPPMRYRLRTAITARASRNRTALNGIRMMAHARAIATTSRSTKKSAAMFFAMRTV